MDKIYIRDLLIRCIIGIKEEERVKKQDVVINIILFVDFQSAAKSDSIEDTVDYSDLKKQIFEAVENSQYYLIEAMAEQVANICLGHSKVQKVQVLVEKPGALRFTKSVGVEIERTR